MKFFIFSVVIFAAIFLSVNCRSPTRPPNPPTPDPKLANAGVDVCDQPNKLGRTSGRASLTRYYYNKDKKECKTFIFGGGPQTDNNFETKEACDARCPSKTTTGDISSTTTVGPERNYDRVITHGEDACSKPLITDTVPPKDAVDRFYFNSVSKECESFKYGGGVTTENHFITKDECITHCVTSTTAIAKITTTIANGDSYSSTTPPLTQLNAN